MKNRKCPRHKCCWDYGNCDDCDIGNAIVKLHKKIDKLKTENEKLKAENVRLNRIAYPNF